MTSRIALIYLRALLAGERWRTTAVAGSISGGWLVRRARP